MADTHVTGLKELQAFLDTLPAKVEKNIMRSALRAGANVVKAEAQQQLQAHGNVKTGVLAAGLKVSTRAKGGTVSATVKAKGKHGYIAHWIEYGVAAHWIKPKTAKSLFFAGAFGQVVHHPGFKPKPFLRPALDGTAGAALVAVGEAIKKRLTKEGIDATNIEVDEQ